MFPIDYPFSSSFGSRFITCLKIITTTFFVIVTNNKRGEILIGQILCFFCVATEASTANQSRANSTVFTTQADGSTHVIGKTSFAVPAPPPLAAGEKIRRLSDTEHFRQPNVTVGHTNVQKQLQEAQTQAQAQALADMILKVIIMVFDNQLVSHQTWS